MENQEPKPIKRRWIAAISAAIATVTTLIVENAHLIEALARLIDSAAR